MSKKFEYRDSKQVPHTIEIEENDFALVQEHVEIHDQKMQSKPTTFFKDAMKRFAKNKSSVVGACVLGTLVLLSIILPIAIQSDVSDNSSVNLYQKELYPKLFDAGTGWWDGCKSVSDVPIDIDTEEYEETGEIVPVSCSSYKLNAIVGGAEGISVNRVDYADGESTSAYGGYVRLSGTSSPAMTSPILPEGLDLTKDQGFTLTMEVSNSSAIEDSTWNYGRETDTYGLYYYYRTGNVSTDSSGKQTTSNIEYNFFPLKTGLTERNGTITVNLDDYREDIAADIAEKTATKTLIDSRLALRISTASGSTGNTNILVKEAIFTASDEALKEACEAKSFDNANAMRVAGSTGSSWWGTYNGTLSAYHVTYFYGSFRYDTYEDALGDQSWAISHANVREWINRGWVRVYTEDTEDGMSLITATALANKTVEEAQAIADSLFFENLTDRSPLINPDEVTLVASGTRGSVSVSITADVTLWKVLFLDRNSCPKYLFGTDYEGKDLLKYAAEGLRTSLSLGLLTFIVCFTFGLIYGAIAGYYGGWTDILMERVTDILGGVPWIVVMTLAIIKWGNTFTVFVLALCFTGWIGTSSTTRTQFYRYKSREYVLAARTLGASDKRLIFRHILPNAVGTIVTSSVLMIPSIIYSEATLAYLQLGLQGQSSFGVMLSDNQIALSNGDAYMILFPSAIMALLMISFNLFGNGLRDAFNPSLKGAEN